MTKLAVGIIIGLVEGFILTDWYHSRRDLKILKAKK